MTPELMSIEMFREYMEWLTERVAGQRKCERCDPAPLKLPFLTVDWDQLHCMDAKQWRHAREAINAWCIEETKKRRHLEDFDDGR